MGYKDSGERAYADIVRDIERTGYRVVELPIGEMRKRFDNSYGYEDGRTVYIGSGLDPAKKVEVAYHEWETMRQRRKTGLSHRAVEPSVMRKQRRMAEDYLTNAREAMSMAA